MLYVCGALSGCEAIDVRRMDPEDNQPCIYIKDKKIFTVVVMLQWFRGWSYWIMSAYGVCTSSAARKGGAEFNSRGPSKLGAPGRYSISLLRRSLHQELEVKKYRADEEAY